jgi:uncharacterized phage-associated protein
MAETSAQRLADFILFSACKREILITNLKLQKLLYYSQAWYLAIADRPLFDERIEAWVHGPVVPPVFGSFKQFRARPISAIPIDGTIEAGLKDRPISDHVREILDIYAGFTGGQLESLTHKEAPWLEARNGLAPDEPSNNVITLKSMTAFFRAQLVTR